MLTSSCFPVAGRGTRKDKSPCPGSAPQPPPSPGAEKSCLGSTREEPGERWGRPPTPGLENLPCFAVLCAGAAENPDPLPARAARVRRAGVQVRPLRQMANFLLGTVCPQACIHPCERPRPAVQVPARLALGIAGAHQPVPLSWQVLRPVPSQADNYRLPDSVVMSPGAHFPSKQFSWQILQRKPSPTEGPGRTAAPVMDA